MAATLAACGTLFSHLPGSDPPKPLRISEPAHLFEEANSAGFRVSRGLRWRAQAGPIVKVTAPLPSSPQVSPGLGGGCSSHLLPVSFLCALDRLPLGLYSSPHLCNDTWGSFQLRWVFWEIIDVLWRGSRLWEVRSFMGVTAPWKEMAAL